MDNYYNWLREKTFIQKDSNTDWHLINTPFVGAFNDTIEIYAQKNGNHLKLSDNGETMSNLELQGLHIQGSKRRRAILDTILLNYGVRAENDELTILVNGAEEGSSIDKEEAQKELEEATIRFNEAESSKDRIEATQNLRKARARAQASA